MYRIEIPASILEESINTALKKTSVSRSDFFSEVRLAFKNNMAEIFSVAGLKVNTNVALGNTNYIKNGTFVKLNPIIKYTGWDNDIKKELDFEFCTKYGHGDYSLKAINYIDREPVSLPSLSSLSGVFSIGNILLIVENKDCDVELSLGDGINSTGYSYHISKRKKKSYFCLFGIWFDPNLINSIISKKSSSYKNDINDLDEIRFGNISYPMTWVNRISGDIYTCSCFRGLFDIADDIERFLPYGNSVEELKNKVRSMKIIESLCHFCCGGMPKIEYGHSMYPSSFLQRYLPYHRLLSQIKFGKPVYEGDEHKLVENELRVKFGYPKIGEGWVTETTLYNIIVSLFPKLKVLHHYRGFELQRLELDIWIPEIQVAIEYQGEQHYKVVKHWGGEEGLKKRMENDKKKKRLCEELGYVLIEFKFSEILTESLVKNIMSKFIE